MKTMREFKQEHMSNLPKISGLLKGKLQPTLKGIVVESRRVGSHILTAIETGKENGRTTYAYARNAKEALLAGSIVNYQLIGVEDAIIL